MGSEGCWKEFAGSEGSTEGLEWGRKGLLKGGSEGRKDRGRKGGLGSQEGTDGGEWGRKVRIGEGGQVEVQEDGYADFVVMMQVSTARVRS